MTPAEAQTKLDTIWYPARDKAAKGQSVTVTSGSGSRSISYTLKDIEAVITRLEGIAAGMGSGTPQGRRKGYAVANFRD